MLQIVRNNVDLASLWNVIITEVFGKFPSIELDLQLNVKPLFKKNQINFMGVI